MHFSRDRSTALFGGTFDPIHRGHINIMLMLQNLGIVEQVIVVPAVNPLHKSKATITPYQDRLNMLHLALQSYNNIAISDFEWQYNPQSYMIKTAQYFMRYFGKHLILLIGSDHLLSLHTWYQAEKLVQKYRFLIYQRPGYPAPDLQILLNHFGKEGAKKLSDAVLHSIHFPESSTDIRRSFWKKKHVGTRFPPQVYRYITRKTLYKYG